MDEPLIIGLGGVAGSGKDTFFNNLKRVLGSRATFDLKVKRYSFGDELKKEVNQWTTTHYGIDAVNCDRVEKEKIRSFLISHGVIKRNRTEGQYWIDKVEKAVSSDEDRPDIACITDVRYNHYKNDEASWVKGKGGVLVYIRRMTVKSNKEGMVTHSCLQAKNPEEQIHDPKVLSVADYIASVKDVEESRIEETLELEIDKLTKWLQENGGEKWSRLLT